MQVAREEIDGGKILIHALDAFGDGRTLCGYAYEGECRPGGGNAVAIIKTGNVTCASCLKIITHCKSIPAKRLAK